MHILFSLPVHTGNNIVRLTIANIQQHVKNCTVVLHVSADFTDFDLAILDIPNVIGNPIRFKTRHGDSQFGVHLSNYEHAVNVGVPFTTFCFFHTSEMFVKAGVEDVISKHSYSLWYDNSTMPKNMAWHPMLYAYNNSIFDGTVPTRDWYLGSLIEGMWISKDIMTAIYDWGRNRPALLEVIPGWTFEEVAFPTLVNWFGKNGSHGEPYNAFFDKDLELADVDKVLNGEPVELWAANCWNSTGVTVVSDGATKYSVKRLSRDLNDPVRQHIIKVTEMDLSKILG